MFGAGALTFQEFMMGVSLPFWLAHAARAGPGWDSPAMQRPSREDCTWSLAAGRVGGDSDSRRTFHRRSAVRLPLA